MFRVEIVDGHRQMAVAVAEIVRLSATLVDRQFKLELALGIALVDEREGLEIEPVGDLEPERLAVEIHGPVFIQNADHGMNGFRHAALPVCLHFLS